MISASAVRVPAQWLDGDTVRREVALFKLGQGPCGLVVTSLAVGVGTHEITIAQEHADGSRKAFVYPLAQLTGRVEIESFE